MSDAWQGFVDSWSLFGTSYLTGLLVAVLLAACGVFVLAQRQVFVGVAVTQASSLGIAIALVVLGEGYAGDHHAHHGVPLTVGVLFAVAAALATSRGLRGRAEADAVGAWIFLLGSSGSVLLLANSPHGLEEVERLTFSSLIGADEHDVLVFSALVIASAVTLGRYHRDALLVSTDPATAHALGRPRRVWQIGIAVWIGASVGVAMHATGALFAFACLVLPALTARELCRTMGAMLWAAPLLALSTTFLAFFAAHTADFPPGQVAAALLSAVLVVGWILRSTRPR